MIFLFVCRGFCLLYTLTPIVPTRLELVGVITVLTTWGRCQPEKRPAAVSVTLKKGDLCRDIIANKPKSFISWYILWNSFVDVIWGKNLRDSAQMPCWRTLIWSIFPQKFSYWSLVDTFLFDCFSIVDSGSMTIISLKLNEIPECIAFCCFLFAHIQFFYWKYSETFWSSVWC